MQKSLTKNSTKISYTVRSSKRAKRLRIAVYCDGAVLVTKPARIPFVSIESFIYNKFQWIVDKIHEFSKKPRKILAHYSNKEFQENKEKALQIVLNRLSHFNQLYKYKIGKVSVRNQRSRWGSCSGRGNLSFNYKIVFLPSELQDYIIVHELCHLKEMNHSSRFWDLVAIKIPDYKDRQIHIKLF